MTNNEALAESIRNYLESGVDLLLSDDDYRTIIKALEPKDNRVKTELNGIKTELEQEPKFIAKADGTIKQIKDCEDCLFKKEWEKIGKLISVVLEKQTEQEINGDYISREKTLEKFCDYVGSGMSMDDFDALYDIVAKMPSVQPKPKTGHWIKSLDSYGNNHFTCPFCEHDIATKYNGTWEDNFCSNCGAKMESEGKK